MCNHAMVAVEIRVKKASKDDNDATQKSFRTYTYVVLAGACAIAPV